MPLALLDLDGTLTDPKEGITRSIQYTLARFGIEVADLDSLTTYIGPPLRDAFSRFHGLTPDQTELAVTAYREYFGVSGIYENTPYDGITECLESLRRDGWRLALATSKPAVYAEEILKHFSLREFFDVVAGSELDGTRSQKDELIVHALERLSVSPTTRCVMIGDREHDILGAKKVGLATFGVTWGYGTEAELVNAGADLLVHRVDDLPNSLAKFAGAAGQHRSQSSRPAQADA